MMSEEEIFGNLYAESSKNGIYKTKEFHGSGYKIVNMGELFGFDFIGSQDMKRVQLTDLEIEKNGLVDGDLLFGRRSLVESGAGKCSIVTNPTEKLVCESSIIRVRLDKSKVEPRFYYYYFLSPQGRARIRSIVTGTNVKGIRGSELQKLKVTLPPLPVQQKIAAILSAYDDLIENNLKRIALLEKSANLLYEEWFVRLRFPGYEHITIVDGVPEGWEKKKIEEVCQTIGGGTPSTKVPEYWNDGDVTWITPTDITRNDCLIILDSEKKITESGLKNSSAKLLPPDTILMTSRASIGFFALIDKVVCTNQGFISVIPNNDNYRMFLLFNLLGRKEEIELNASGTTFKEISKSRFRSMDITLPSETIAKEFNQQVYKLIHQVRLLKKANSKLKQARDILLPKLINGDITV